MSWCKESTERRKTSFLKQTVENADLHKAVLNKIMTTQEQCVKNNLKRSLNGSFKDIPFFQAAIFQGL